MRLVRLCMIAVALLINAAESKAQWYKNLKYEAEVSFLYGLAEKNGRYSIRQSDLPINARALQFNALCQEGQKWSGGVGLRMARYTGTGDNTIGIQALTKYKPFRKIPNMFVLAAGGYNWGTDDFTGGYIGDLSVGYGWSVNNRFVLNARLGYNYTNLKREMFDGDGIHYVLNSHRHSISAAVGLLF